MRYILSINQNSFDAIQHGDALKRLFVLSIGVIYTGDAGDMSPPLFEMADFVPTTFRSIWLKCSEKSSEPRNVKGLFG